MRTAFRRAGTAIVLAGVTFVTSTGLNPILAADPPAVPAEVTSLDIPEPGPGATTGQSVEASGAQPVMPGAVTPSPESAAHSLRAAEVEDFALVGASWDGDGVRGAWVRVLRGTSWSEWSYLPPLDAEADPGSADAQRAGQRRATEPLWVGDGAHGVEVRLDADRSVTAPRARVDLVDPGDPPATAGAADAAPRPGIVTRAQWGADESLRRSVCPSGPSYASSRPKAAFVHHTADSNGYSAADSPRILRSIYSFHVKSRGWCDIGYNFLVDKYGQVFEGRAGGMDRAVIGAHTENYNSQSFGISVIGNYSSARPSAAVLDAISRVVAWKLSMNHMNPSGTTVLSGKTFNVISGHRDAKSTDCPGANLYGALGQIRARVATLMREKVWLTRNTPGAGAHDAPLWYGGPADTTLACDFDGDGRDTFAVYRNGHWAVRSAPGGGPASAAFHYGDPSMRPVCGDWDGDGRDGIGVYDANGWFWLRETASPGAPHRLFQYGWRGAIPVVGDWDGGGGPDGVGVYDGGLWMLRRSASPGPADAAVVRYGWRGATPVPGDWDSDGRDTLGVYERGGWWLRDALTPGGARHFRYGDAGYAPVVGDWDGPGGHGVGVTRTWP